jgi:hypothetical protein
MWNRHKSSSTELASGWGLHSSGKFCCIDWSLVSNISVQTLGPIFKGVSYEKEDENGRLSRIVGNKLPISTSNIPAIMKFAKECKKALD